MFEFCRISGGTVKTEENSTRNSPLVRWSPQRAATLAGYQNYTRAWHSSVDTAGCHTQHTTLSLDTVFIDGVSVASDLQLWLGRHLYNNKIHKLTNITTHLTEAACCLSQLSTQTSGHPGAPVECVSTQCQSVGELRSSRIHAWYEPSWVSHPETLPNIDIPTVIVSYISGKAWPTVKKWFLYMWKYSFDWQQQKSDYQFVTKWLTVWMELRFWVGLHNQLCRWRTWDWKRNWTEHCWTTQVINSCCCIFSDQCIHYAGP